MLECISLILFLFMSFFNFFIGLDGLREDGIFKYRYVVLYMDRVDDCVYVYINYWLVIGFEIFFIYDIF